MVKHIKSVQSFNNYIGMSIEIYKYARVTITRAKLFSIKDTALDLDIDVR